MEIRDIKELAQFVVDLLREYNPEQQWEDKSFSIHKHYFMYYKGYTFYYLCSLIRTLNKEGEFSDKERDLILDTISDKLAKGIKEESIPPKFIDKAGMLDSRIQFLEELVLES